MVTFDGWESRLYGDAMALPSGPISEDTLMHWRTKGSKNGVRRYQNTDGSWTPLGIKLRKEREGWGEAKRQKRENAAKQREERKQRFTQRREQRQQQMEQRRQQRSLKGVSDEELRKRIERIKLEKEYKELTRSPALVMGEKVVNTIIQAKKNAADRKERETKMEKDMIEAKAKLLTAEADKAYAAKRGNVKARKFKAKADLKKEKNQERKATIRGAISQAVNNRISSHSSRRANELKGKATFDTRVKKILAKAGTTPIKAIKGNAADRKARKQYVNDWLVKGEAARLEREARERMRRLGFK